MTAENIYLYLLLVGVFFAAGNLAISGIGHIIGGLGGDGGHIDAHGDGGHGSGDGHAALPHVDGGGADAPDFGDAGGTDAQGFDMDAPDAGGDMPETYAFPDAGRGGTAASSGDIAADAAASGAHGHSQDSGGGPAFLSLLTNWLPLRPTALICFATVTGGVGSICTRLGWANPLAHILSIAAGYGIAMLIGVRLPRWLRRAQNTSAAERYELIGLSARVTSAILEGGFGRISYVVHDNAYGAPARHIEGKRVPQGALVVICEIRQNVFYVSELDN